MNTYDHMLSSDGPATSMPVNEVGCTAALRLDDAAWDALNCDFSPFLLDVGAYDGLLETSRALPAPQLQHAHQQPQAESMLPFPGAKRASTDTAGCRSSHKRNRNSMSDQSDGGGREGDVDASDKLERARNRNRVSQARRRQRQREEIETLENQAVHCRDSIQRALQRSRVSRDQKLSLIDRVSAADRELLQISTHIPCAPLGLHSDSMDSAVVPALAQWSNHPVRTLHGCRSWHRPIESHMLHCPLYLESCLKSSAAWSRTTVFSFSDRLETHKAEVASQLGAASADVCWFLQTLYKTASGSHISISTGLATITCTITLLFTYLMDGFEGSLVDKEIECLDGRAEDSGCSDASFESLSAEEDSHMCSLVSQPLLCVSQWSEGITLSCGVNEGADLAETVRDVVGGAAREYRGRMPERAWRRRCCDFLRRLEIAVGRKGADGKPQPRGPKGPEQRAGTTAGVRLPDSDDTTFTPEGCGSKQSSASKGGEYSGQAASGVEDAGGGGQGPAHELQRCQSCGQPECAMPKFEGTFRMIALVVQLMADGLHECMQEPAVSEGQKWSSEMRRHAAEERATLLYCAQHYMWCALLHDSPFTARDISVDFCGPGVSSLDWLEGTHGQLYKRLQLNRDQRASMVLLWREWKHHRHALDGDLKAAMDCLGALPDVDIASDAFLALVSARCTGVGVTAAATAAVGRLQPQVLLGMSAAATSHAAMVLDSLEQVQTQDSRLQVDFLAANIRPWYWTGTQMGKLLAASASHRVKLDVFMLWRIAMFQERRQELFVCRDIP